MERGIEEKKAPILFLGKSLIFSYIVTILLLLLLTLLVYKAGLTEKMVSIAMIAVYVIATFLTGFLVGKKMQNRKFLWGLLMGAAYFLILLLVSLVVNKDAGGLGNSVVTTLVLCAGGGMLGGMLS